MKNAADYIIPQENGKSRYLSSVSALSRAFALSVPHEKAMALREEIGFFQTVRGTLIKTTLTDDEQKNPELVDSAVRQIVSLCVKANDLRTARILFRAIQAVSIREDVLNEHPTLLP